jgi:hypothetical protein
MLMAPAPNAAQFAAQFEAFVVPADGTSAAT